MALIPMNTRVRWHDRCVSTGIQIVADSPSIFKYKTAVGITVITSVEHTLGNRVIFVSVAPTENELDTNDPSYFLLLTRSRRRSLKKRYPVQGSAIFWVTFVVTSKKTNKRIRHSVKKESYLFLFLLVSRVNGTSASWKHFASFRNKWPTKAILYRNKINMEEFLILEFLIRRLFYSGLLDIKWI